MRLVLILGLLWGIQWGVIDGRTPEVFGFLKLELFELIFDCFCVDLLVNYEGGLPPNYPSQTEVVNHIYVEDTNDEDESNMIFSLMIDLVSVWTDPQLAYSDTISTKSSIDLSDDAYKVWKPQIQITDNVRDEGIFSFNFQT